VDLPGRLDEGPKPAARAGQVAPGPGPVAGAMNVAPWSVPCWAWTLDVAALERAAAAPSAAIS
jgi:hypothetical protein